VCEQRQAGHVSPRMAAGQKGAAAASDVGQVISPNSGDWWAFDTHHLAPADVQVSG
jgi:hypothetical protein